MKNPNRWIMGSAIGLAALATAIDHTRHRLPEPESVETVAEQDGGYHDADIENPCGMGESPCSLSQNENNGDDEL